LPLPRNDASHSCGSRQGYSGWDLRTSTCKNAFWMQATWELAWCWRPTISPYIYARGVQFDPRSRCFAFEDDRLVGYMSFTGKGKFVSLGYPWVLPGYEGALQGTLYERVYGFAASPEYGSTTFAQRFRQPWPAQISFFKRHGFAEAQSTPVYVLEARSAKIQEISIVSGIEIRQGFRWEEFRQRASGYGEKELNMFEQYFRSVDFDFSVTATSRSGRAAHLSFAIRPDTGFAELIAVARDPGGPEMLAPCLASSLHELRSRKVRFLGTGPVPEEGAFETLLRMGFNQVSKQVLLSKSIAGDG
jgi:hypothetical protein